MKYVIVGNSTAAVGCIEGIRQTDPDGLITILSREPYHTYSRPLISYLLCGKTDLERMKYRPDSFYQDQGCEFLPGTEAKAILPEEKTVITQDGSCVPYDKLLVAAGSVPFVPPIPGMENVVSRTCFLSLDDALRLEGMLSSESRVLILGAGLIGLKCAEGIVDRVKHIHVCDLADRLLSSVLDSHGAQLVQRHLETYPITFSLGQSVREFPSANTAILTDGTQLEFDILVTAVGVRPNTALIQEAGGEVARGIVIDGCCRTTLPDVYAAGDCTESLDISSGNRRVMAVLPNAFMQGFCAGVNMAGGERIFGQGMPMNAGGFLGLHLVTAGSYDGDAYVVEDGENYKKLVIRDNRLVGFLIVGDVRRAGIYTALIRDRTDLRTIDFSLIAEKPQLMAFSKLQRQDILRRRAE